MPFPGRQRLELRVDIDSASPLSPVMNRVSGDLYQQSQIAIPGQPQQAWWSFIESWIVDRPKVVLSACGVEISGEARFWRTVHPATTVLIQIGWSDLQPAGPAIVTFTESGGLKRSFSCDRVSEAFRDVNIEIDVCSSVNRVPLLPQYDTSSHDVRPANLPTRMLTIENAYREAGLSVTVNQPGADVIDDSNPSFETWSAAELHDAMVTHFSNYSESGSQWKSLGSAGQDLRGRRRRRHHVRCACQFGGSRKGPGPAGLCRVPRP